MVMTMSLSVVVAGGVKSPGAIGGSWAAGSAEAGLFFSFLGGIIAEVEC